MSYLRERKFKENKLLAKTSEIDRLWNELTHLAAKRVCAYVQKDDEKFRELSIKLADRKRLFNRIFPH